MADIGVGKTPQVAFLDGTEVRAAGQVPARRSRIRKRTVKER